MTPEQLWKLIEAGEEISLVVVRDAYLDAGEEGKAASLELIIDGKVKPEDTTPVGDHINAYSWYHPLQFQDTYQARNSKPVSFQHWERMKRRREEFSGVLVGHYQGRWTVITGEETDGYREVLDFESEVDAIRAWVECS